MLLPTLPAPKSAWRRKIYGERPLAPLTNAPVVWKPRRSLRRWAFLIASALSYIVLADIIAGWIIRR